MDADRLTSQLQFIIEIDKMKTIIRRTLLMDGSRRENDAEHSWHIAILAMVLKEYANKPVNIDKVVKMCLVHDLVEVYAGDTYAYDDKGNATKLDRETAAADKLFSILPDGQGDEIRALWEEFDAHETDEAKFALGMDRLQPILHNFITEGVTWKEGHVTSDKVLKRNEGLKDIAPELWDLIEWLVNTAVERGYLAK